MFIFTKVNLSSCIVCRLSIGAFRKQFLKPFGLDQPEAFLLTSSELNGHPTRFSFARCSGFFFYTVFFSTDNFAFLTFQIAIPI